MLMTDIFLDFMLTGALLDRYRNNSTEYFHRRRSSASLPFHQPHTANKYGHQPLKDTELIPVKGHTKYREQIYPFAPGFYPNFKAVNPNEPFISYDDAKLPGFYPMQYPGFHSRYNLDSGGYPRYNPFLYPEVPGFGAAKYPGSRYFMYPKYQPGFGCTPYPGLVGMKPLFGHYCPKEGEMGKNHRGRREFRN